jgi:hypothetical protein
MSDNSDDVIQSGPIYGPAAYTAVIDLLAMSAKRDLLILDTDLSYGDYDSSARIDAFRRLLLPGTGRRIVILLENNTRLDRHLPRLMRLYADFSHAMHIHLLPEHVHGAYLPFLVSDGRNCLRWLSREAHRYALDLDSAANANRLTDVFDELLTQSGVPMASKILGL